jgi:hypothetical protein
MPFDVIHVDDFTDDWALIELSHVIGNVMIRSEESLIALGGGGGGWIDEKQDQESGREDSSRRK